MLQFKPRQFETEETPNRWKIGVDRRHVAAYVALALVLGIAIGFSLGRYRKPPAPPTASDQRLSARPPVSEPEPEFHNVTRVLRGDTIEVDGVGPVRLLGVETPDGKTPVEIYGAHGQRALNYIQKTLLGQSVRIEYDSSGSRIKDDAGQTHAYVYTRDGVLINAELVRQGLAFVYDAEHLSLANDFRALEREAMQGMRGVWGPSTPGVASAPVAAPPPKEEKPAKLSPLPPSALGANIPAISSAQNSSLEPSVWVSPADKMYHKSGCSFLDKKKHSILLSQAKSEGYTACSRCYASTVLKAP